jgi:phage-related minor tail protein
MRLLNLKLWRSAPRNELKDLQKRIALDTKLLGVSREQAQVERAIANSKIAYSEQDVANTVKELEAYNLKLSKMKEAQALYATMESSLESGFMAMVDGTKSVEDAFKSMAKSVIAELYRVLVVKRMVGNFESGTGIMGFLGGIFGGGAVGGGGRASGGTVMSGTPYLVGEKGPELIVPQNRGHVMNADLTAKAMNGSGGTVVVNQNFNFQANGDDSVKRIIAQAAPSIANMAKQSVIDARRRGGVMKNTFG